MARVSFDQSNLLCRKCKQKKELVRHHKGNDLFVGNYNKRIKKEYFQYKDCISICNECHMMIHWIYWGHQQKWEDRTARGAVVFRRKCIHICNLWLLGVYSSVPEPWFILKWNERYDRYRKTKRSRSK